MEIQDGNLLVSLLVIYYSSSGVCNLRSCYLHDREGDSFSAKLSIRMCAAPSTFRSLQCDALCRYPVKSFLDAQGYLHDMNLRHRH